MKITLTLLLTLIITRLNAKPRIINIDNELTIAQRIEFCNIISFNDSSIKYEVTYLKSDSKGIATNQKIYKSAKLHLYQNSLIGTFQSGSLPKIGQNCYIVIDSMNFVSLFGVTKENSILFWSPIYTESACLIKHSSLFTSSDKLNAIDREPKLGMCWTSVTIFVIDFVENFKLNFIECGIILFQENKILFIPDFADSRAYSIKDKSYNFKNGQKLCLEWNGNKNTNEIIKQIE